MKLTIDNYDGLGAVDYTGAVATAPAMRIERTLNAPGICSFALIQNGLSTPRRLARVVVSSDSGSPLFTGYVVRDPALALAGEGMSGPAYLAEVSAVSDDLLLDLQMVPQTPAAYGETVGQVAVTLTQGTGGSRFSTAAAAGLKTAVGEFAAEHGVSWSKNLELLADATRSAYTVQGGTLTLAPVGTTVHSLSEEDGTLQVSALQASQARMLANDVTVCGEVEASAYVTEIFQGDGTTMLFDLAEEPFTPAGPDTKALNDQFQGPTVDPRKWNVLDNSSHISVTTAGLTVSGGNGVDGGSTVSALTQLELSGAMVLEAQSVMFNGASQGVLHALYSGDAVLANCVAGFAVSTISGASTITPVIHGVTTGASFTPVASHQYTLRLRFSTWDTQRLLQTYHAVGDTGLVSFGGTTLDSNLNLLLEVQDTTGGVNGNVTVLYDGQYPSAPAAGSYVLLNSYDLQCSIAAVNLAHAAAVWVTSTPPGSGSVTRRLGAAAQKADARLESAGRLRYYPASIPARGELVYVSYRTRRRSVARLSSSALTAPSEGLPAQAAWSGSVTSPRARSSQDCENAAQALLALSTSRAAAWQGRYTAWNTDVWPGDVLAVSAPSAGLQAMLVVRSVTVEPGHSAPELVKYTIQFANDWATDLAMRLTETVPADAWVPQQAAGTVMALPGMHAFSVTAVTGGRISVNTNIDPPAGGGFEVRRRDWAFGPGSGGDLVLRSAMSSFDIPRSDAMEQYYVRMYDGATPPNYSRVSSAVFVNVPLQ